MCHNPPGGSEWDTVGDGFRLEHMKHMKVGMTVHLEFCES
jgi:hypothetical protein